MPQLSGTDLAHFYKYKKAMHLLRKLAERLVQVRRRRILDITTNAKILCVLFLNSIIYGPSAKKQLTGASDSNVRFPLS